MAQLTHKLWMGRALEEARLALEHGDVPVGAAVVRDGEILALAHNRREADQDPSAHAELIAVRAAAATLGSWRLEGCALYVTLEPCTMCAGALVLARLPLLVYGAKDPKAGAVDSLYDLVREPRLNHRVEVVEGVLADECGDLLRDFFRAARARSRTDGPRWSGPGAATLPDRSGGVASTGLVRGTRNAVWQQCHRGFESHLHHLSPPPTCAGSATFLSRIPHAQRVGTSKHVRFVWDCASRSRYFWPYLLTQIGTSDYSVPIRGCGVAFWSESSGGFAMQGFPVLFSRARGRRVGAALLTFAMTVSLMVAGAYSAAAASPVSLTQSASSNPVGSGEQLTYTIVTTNTGGAKVSGVVLTDVVNGLTGVDGVGPLTLTSNVGTCGQTGNTVRCDAGTLAGGQVWTVTIRGKVTAAAGETLNNTATVTGTKSAQTFSQASTISTQVASQGSSALPDLTVAVTAPSTTPLGSDYLYQLVVNNKGSANTTDVALTATLPDTVAFQSTDATSLFACSHDGAALGGTLTCTGGAVNQGANATIRLGVQAPATGQAVTLSTVVDPFDAISEASELNNAVQNTVQVTNAPPVDALALAKTDGPDPLTPYQTLNYTSTIKNTSAYRADYMTFTDGTQGLEAASVTVTASATGTSVQPTCTVAAPTVTCDITRFQPGAVMTVSINGLVTASPGTTIINTATVNGNIRNKGLTSTATTITTVRPARDLTVTQARTLPAPPNPVRAADRFDYSIVVGNSGLFDANGVQVRQPLPSGVYYDGTTLPAAAGSCSVDVDNVLSCTLVKVRGVNSSGLPQGDTVPFTIKLIAPHKVGPITSTVTIDPSNSVAENDESNNTATTTTQVLTGIDLTTTLTQLHDPIARNGTQTYTIKVPNIGTQGSTGIVVRNVLPTGSRFRTANGDHNFTCSASEQVVTCLGGAILGTYSGSLTRPVDVATITIDVFAQDEPGIAHDEVRIDPEGTIDEKDESNNIAMIDGVVGNAVDAGSYIDLSFDPITESFDPIATSGTLDYTFTARNTGSADAFQTVAAITLPAGAAFRSAQDTAPGPGAFTCTHEASIVTCIGGTVKSADTRKILVRTFAPPAPGTALVRAALDPNNAIGESDESDNKQDETTQIVSGSPNGIYNDLLVSSITVNHDPVAPDGTLEYSVTTSNAGAADAFDVTFRATLPPGARFRGADDQGGTGDAYSCVLSDDSIVTCTGAKIPALGARTVKIAVFAPSQPGSYRLDTFIDPNAAIPEGNEGNNAAEKSVVVQLGGGGGFTDLQIGTVEARSLGDDGTVGAAITKVAPGQTYGYQVTTKNAGTDDAFNVPLRIVLPSGVEALDVEADGNFLCASSANVVDCTGGHVKGSGTGGGDRTITIKAVAPQKHNVLLRTTVAVDPANSIPESDETNNTKQVATTVRSLVDLNVTNGWSGGSAGSQVTYTASMTNTAHGDGGADAINTVFTVSAPVGTIIEDAKVDKAIGWSCTVYENPVNQVSCVGDKLASGDTVTMTLKVFITSKSGATSSTTVADPDEAVVEFDELNNSAQATA